MTSLNWLGIRTWSLRNRRKKGTKVAHHKSAKKRILTNAKKRSRNQSYISSVRSAVKKVRLALEKGLSEEVAKLFIEAQSLLHKAASRGLIHKNNASRKVARLDALVKSKASAKA